MLWRRRDGGTCIEAEERTEERGGWRKMADRYIPGDRVDDLSCRARSLLQPRRFICRRGNTWKISSSR